MISGDWARSLSMTAALVLVAGLSGCGGSEEEPTTPDEDVPVTLQLPASPEGRCAAPTPERLAEVADLAFDGTVTDINGSDVTLEVKQWYAGDQETPEVLVSAVRGSASIETGPDFAKGERYLVSANGTEVTLCNYSGLYSEKLERTYQQAFSG